MARGRLVQASLFDVSPPATSRQQEGAPPRRRGRARPARPNYVRVTRDAQVALAWDQSHRLSSEVTQRLAERLTEDQLAQLRALVRGASAGSGAKSRPMSRGGS